MFLMEIFVHAFILQAMILMMNVRMLKASATRDVTRAKNMPHYKKTILQRWAELAVGEMFPNLTDICFPATILHTQGAADHWPITNNFSSCRRNLGNSTFTARRFHCHRKKAVTLMPTVIRTPGLPTQVFTIDSPELVIHPNYNLNFDIEEQKIN